MFITTVILKEANLSSSTHLSWFKPIAVTRDLLVALEDRLKQYSVIAAREMVSNEGADPDQIRTAADATAKGSETKDWRYDRIARELEKLEKVSWAVGLSNGIRRSSLTLDDVLALPNAGDALVVDLEGSVGNYTTKLEVQLRSNSRACATASVLGEYNDVHLYKAEITQLYAGATRNWSMVTQHWVGFIIMLAAILASMLTAAIVVLQIGLARKWGSETAAGWLWAVPGLIATMWMIFGSRLTRKWEEIFPMVEFQFGGGQNLSEARRAWRKAAWSVPIILIGFPLAINWLSAEIF